MREPSILHKNTLGHLQFEKLRVQAGLFENRKDAFEKASVLKLDCGNVDGNLRFWQS